MHETAFHLAIAGVIVLVASLPIRVLLKERWIAWGAVIVALNFLSQSYMVVKEITFPYIAMPNVVLFGYFLFFFIKIFINHKQK